MQEPGSWPSTGAGKRRPRVLILIKEFGLGGAERLVADVLASRDRTAFDYEAAYVLHGHDTLVPDVEAAGVPVHDLGATRGADLRWMARLRRLLVERDYDIVHAHLPYTAALGRVAAATLAPRRRPALVYTEHSMWNKAALITRALNRATVPLNQALFVVSSASRDALPVGLRSHAQIVLHGVDLSRSATFAARRQELRAEVRAELGLAEDEVFVLTVANLRSEKGYDVLLEAARLALAQGAAAHFVSVGWGPLADTLSEERDRLGLKGRFDFLGRRDDALRIMAGADVFVLPSHQEGLPVALMEAMSVGLPVVASAIGGVPDIVTDGVEGLLVTPGRADELAQAIGRVTRDEPLRARLGRGASARSESLDVTQAARTIENTYRRILAERAAPDDTKPLNAAPPTRSGLPLVVHVIPTAVGRGAQREARAIADRLGRAGTRRHILLSLFAGPQEVGVEEALAHPGGTRVAQGLDPRLIVRLARTLARLGPDVVVAHGGDALKYLAPAMALRRRPLVYYATGTFAAGASPAQVRMWRALLRRATVVAAEGDEVLEECAALLGVPRRRLVLAPNGRDPDEFRPAPLRSSPVPTVAFVGALTAGKRPDMFVDVIQTMRDRDLTLHAVICGGGPGAGALSAAATAAGVELLGFRSDVAEVLRGADVMLFPSRPTGEGMPGVLIEAGLSAVPVVATDVPGVKMIVADGETGIVTGVDDVAAMADATARLIADPELRARMGAAARQRCVTYFSLDAVAACWEAIIEPLVARGGQP